MAETEWDRHLPSVTEDGLTASCSCGWQGTARSTPALAVQDHQTHVIPLEAERLALHREQVCLARLRDDEWADHPLAREAAYQIERLQALLQEASRG